MIFSINIKTNMKTHLIFIKIQKTMIEKFDRKFLLHKPFDFPFATICMLLSLTIGII